MIYAAKFKIEPKKLMERLWGDQFYNAKEKKWNQTGGDGYVRGFNQFVLDPIFKVLSVILKYGLCYNLKIFNWFCFGGNIHSVYIFLTIN